MSTVTLPTGTVPVKSLTTGQVLTGNRETTVRVDLFDEDEAPKGTLSGVLGGSVDYTTAASVHGGGLLIVADEDQDVDWLTDRVRPVLTIDGITDEIPLGMFLAGEAPETWTDTGRVWTVGLLDKTAVLDQDAVDDPYVVESGSTITDEVVTIIGTTGETNIAVTPSTATLPADMVWEPGTSKLRIVNDLLDVAGYFSLFTGPYGEFRAEPYVKPANRPVLWEFLDGPTAIYSPDFVRDVDLYSIPNKVVVIGQGDADTAALTASATNSSSTSPYSTTNRGRTITRVETGVEAADQTTLDAYALRRLIELTSPTASVEVQHALVPGLAINSAVRLRRVPAGINSRHVISKTSVSLDPTALVTSTLTEVVDL